MAHHLVTHEIKSGMHKAILACMTVLQRAQYRALGVIEEKSDGTILTASDKESEAAGKAELRKIKGVTIHGEETGEEGKGEIVIYLDGLDGSIPFAAGAGTSTVIVAAVSNDTGRVLCVMVGQPSTGMIWSAEEGEETHRQAIVGRHAYSAPRVSDAVLSHKSRVFVDSYPGFTKSGRTVLATEQLDILHSFIQSKMGLLALGSNGLHHALVANGAPVAAGAITTAIGGPWDVCPVLLVLQAGGAAAAFSVEKGRLVIREPLEVGTYDILITGNSHKTVQELTEFLQQALWSIPAS